MSAYSDLILATTDLALYWRLGESSGTNANDETANNRDGTYTGGFTLGAAGLVPSDADTAVDLDGVNGMVTSTYAPFAAGSQRTFEMWINRDTQTTADTLFASSATSTIWFRAPSASRDLDFGTNTASTVAWTNALPAAPTGGVYVALTYDDSTKVAELFVNGLSKGQRTLPLAYIATGGTFRVGGTANPFDGKLDEVAVYTRVLSPAEIAAHAGVTLPTRVSRIRLAGAWSDKPVTIRLAGSFVEKPVTA